MRRLTLLVVFLAASTPASAEPPSRASIIGAWIPRGEDCAGDADGLIIDADGTWGHYDVGGRWKLRDNILTLVAMDRQAPGSDEPNRKITPPKRDRYVVKSASNHQLLLKRADGTEQAYVRCR